MQLPDALDLGVWDVSRRGLGRITKAARKDRLHCGEASAQKITEKMSPTLHEASAIGM